MTEFEQPGRDTGAQSQPDQLLHAFLACATARDAIAIDVPPGRDRPTRQTMTYDELDKLSAAMARHLRARVSGEGIVALLIARDTPLLYVAQIAVLRAGAAFTCLDPSFPDERMGEIIEDAAPVCVLADGAGLARLAGIDLGGMDLGRLGLAQGVLIDAEALAKAPPVDTPLPEGLTAERLAYVIYTSGTTGKPKGVMVEHRNIANLVAGDIAEFGLGPGDRVVQGSSAAYDSSIEEMWLALASGACLVVMDDAAARLGPDIIGWLADERITVFCPPPTLLRSSGCGAPDVALPLLRLLYVGGEALPSDLADLWARGRRMVNGYGPTECAVTCVRGDVVVGRPIGIGQAVPGMRAYVLDDRLEEVSGEARGELCMGGAGLARGYRHLPEMTAQKFVDHPTLGRIYRTGDLVHRDARGDIFYHGRIDAQVKIRGYRVELGEIEARLAALDGVREAGCRMQMAGTHNELIGFVVAENPAQPPATEALRAALRDTLPAYMVPVQIALIAALPTTVGGKLDRAHLPELALAQAAPGEIVAPVGEMEGAIAGAMADVLRRPAGVSVEDDFFIDLGGDSLSAALLVSLLRDDPRTQWVTVSDIYEARSVRALGQMAHGLYDANGAAPAELAVARVGAARPVLANVVQIGWLAAEVLVSGWLGWFVAFWLFPGVYAHLGAVGLVLAAPLIAIGGFVAYTPCAIALTVALKRLLIGRYTPMRVAMWSGWYLRHWVVVQACHLIPWPLIQGSGLQIRILRWLGARIGEGVHIHRGVDVARGGWDLLALGDGVALGQDAALGLADLDRGDVVFGPITLEAGVCLQTRAAGGGWCAMGAGSQLTALSVLNPGGVIPAGELWDGVPAACVGGAPGAPVLTPGAGEMPRWAWDLCATAGEGALGLLAALPAQGLAVAACWFAGIRLEDLWHWAWHPSFLTCVGTMVLGLTFVSVPVTLVWSALLLRAMGQVAAGVWPRWSMMYLRAWLKAGVVILAGNWLTGTVFWSHWLRLAGMKVGPKCEISTIIDVVPELVEIGAETFFADGIYLGGGHVEQGTVSLGAMRLGRNTFLGNHVVIPPGEHLPDDILIGIATRANAEEIDKGEARFGHPSFDLPRREVVEIDRSLTHEPGLLRYTNRMCWEIARFALPLWPLVLTALWFQILSDWQGVVSPMAYAFAVIPLATLMPLVALCLTVLALKWALIGRVRPGQHALWSCWCSRWDYVYVAWARYATRILRKTDGTFLLPLFLRAMGLKIGRRAVLGPMFAQVVDPDMIEIGDGATVSAMFQAHTFEDRVLKVDKVRIGAGATIARGTVPLYGAHVSEGAHVGANSVIMKHEHLLAGLRYQGVPSRVLGRE